MKKLTISKSVDVVDHVATGAEMRKLRIAKGVSLRQMGEVLHLSVPFLSDLELGRRAWSEERASQYVAVLK